MVYPYAGISVIYRIRARGLHKELYGLYGSSVRDTNQTEVCPGIAAEVFDIEVFITRSVDDLLVMHTRPWPDCIHSPSFVVLVPGATVVLPHGVFNPFLESC